MINTSINEESITLRDLVQTLSIFITNSTGWENHKVYLQCNNGEIKSISPIGMIVLPEGSNISNVKDEDISLINKDILNLLEYNGGFFLKEL